LVIGILLIGNILQYITFHHYLLLHATTTNQLILYPHQQALCSFTSKDKNYEENDKAPVPIIASSSNGPNNDRNLDQFTVTTMQHTIPSRLQDSVSSLSLSKLDLRQQPQPPPSETTTLQDQSLLNLCFVTAEFSKTVEEADVLPVVDLSMRRNPKRHFVYTNLPNLINPDNSWERIVLTPHDVPYQRMITQSRWPKFMGWKHPALSKNSTTITTTTTTNGQLIQSNIKPHCQVIFYGDAYLLNPINETFWQDVAQTIYQSDVGLMQHAQQAVQNIAHEIHKNIRLGKLSPETGGITNRWLRQQSDFHGRIPVYKNALFGYAPHNVKFQQMATDFWNEYSKEVGSWRDQPYWAYFLHHHHMTPLKFPLALPHVEDFETIKSSNQTTTTRIGGGRNREGVLPFGAIGQKGHAGHTYVQVDIRNWSTVKEAKEEENE
jgi:hypothetical protein